jgi:flagella basal body P-ring formation protein FlgA
MKTKRTIQFRHLLESTPVMHNFSGGTSNDPHRTSSDWRRPLRPESEIRCSAFDIFHRARTSVLGLICSACLGGGFALRSVADEPSDLAPSPAAAETMSLLTTTNTTVLTPPRQRALGEADLLQLLTHALQQESVRDRGELELRLTRPWTPRNVPDEPLTVKILEMPNSGVSAAFIIRFELRTAKAVLGTYQLPLQARIWREVWVAHSGLKRGDLIANAEVARERRDVLPLREQFAEFQEGDPSLEMAEPLQSGAPLLARSIKTRPVIRRGQTADALVQDGALSISMKVEVLEDGAPGQVIRARNSQSRRDIRGKVLNQQTIVVVL